MSEGATESADCGAHQARYAIRLVATMFVKKEDSPAAMPHASPLNIVPRVATEPNPNWGAGIVLPATAACVLQASFVSRTPVTR